MKKKNAELMRVQNLIESDRLNLGDGFEKLFLNDLLKLLRDYYDVRNTPAINIDKNIKGYSVNISFDATAIKNVNFLP